MGLYVEEVCVGIAVLSTSPSRQSTVPLHLAYKTPYEYTNIYTNLFLNNITNSNMTRTVFKVFHHSSIYHLPILMRSPAPAGLSRIFHIYHTQNRPLVRHNHHPLYPTGPKGRKIPNNTTPSSRAYCKPGSNIEGQFAIRYPPKKKCNGRCSSITSERVNQGRNRSPLYKDHCCRQRSGQRLGEFSTFFQSAVPSSYYGAS